MKTRKTEKPGKEKEEDLFDTLGITNYERGIVLYKVDIKDFIIKKFVNKEKEQKRLGELVEMNEFDTVMMNENNGENNIESEDSEEDQDKTKIELKKSEILSKQHSTTSKSVNRLQWTSFLIIMIHVIIAIIYFYLCKTVIEISLQYLSAVDSLSTQLNYTISSVDNVLDIVIYNRPDYTAVNDKLGAVSQSNEILQYNAKTLYNLNNDLNSLSIFSKNNISNLIDLTMNYFYIETEGVINKIQLSYFEGLLEVSSFKVVNVNTVFNYC